MADDFAAASRRRRAGRAGPARAVPRTSWPSPRRSAATRPPRRRRAPAHRQVPPRPARRGGPARGRVPPAARPHAARRRPAHQALPPVGARRRRQPARAPLRPRRGDPGPCRRADAGRSARRGCSTPYASPADGRRPADGVGGRRRTTSPPSWPGTATSRAVEDGRVVLANCPFHALAQDHTELVCGMNLALIQALVDESDAVGVTASLDPAPGRCCVTLDGRLSRAHRW